MHSRILLVAPSHGFPPTLARLSRPAEIACRLVELGARVDLVLLVERALQPFEEDAIDELRTMVEELVLVPHPAQASALFRSFVQLRQAFSCEDRLGGSLHCPGRFLRLLKQTYVPRRYDAVIACGVHLARALAVFPAWTDKLLDLERIGGDAYAAHEKAGRGDALSVYRDPQAEIDLLGLAEAVLVPAVDDAVRLRELGFRGDILPAALTGLLLAASASRLVDPVAAAEEPVRPPRLLCVGSETVSNLDAVRWFRRQVYPRIVRTLPTCRLRLVGEMARHIEPGPGVDRIGWVDCLEEEYRDAAVVVVPLRMGSGVRRRAVEALVRGKVLATTSVGARGLRLRPQHDAIVADEAAALAAEICRALDSDALRRAYEGRALALAREAFSPERAFAALAERLGLKSQPEPVGVPAEVLVEV